MKTIILFHRGDVFKYKENTFESIVNIQTNKILDNINYQFGVEFDIQLNKDNNLICYHDDTIKGLDIQIEKSNDTIIIENDINFLEDILKKITSKDIIMNIELKIYNLTLNKIHFLCNKLILILKKYDLNFLLSSFNKEAIKYLLEKKIYKLGMIFFDKIDNECKNLIPKLDYIIIDKNFTCLTDEYKDKNILFYTLKKSNYDKELLNKYKFNKKIGFISDNVNELIKYLEDQ